MSRDEATHYTIGVFLPQNPLLPHKLCIFQALLFIQQLGSLINGNKNYIKINAVQKMIYCKNNKVLKMLHHIHSISIHMKGIQ